MQRYLLLILLLAAMSLNAQIRKELQRLETGYLSGSIDELADRLPTIKAANDDERAFVSHYGALLKKTRAEALELHLRAGDRYAKTLYGQKSLLEAAIIHILDRNYSEAQAQLRKISSPQIPERMYWLAVASYAQDDYSSAIANAENYLRLSPQGLHAENALHLISDSYREQGKHHSSVQTLDKITKIRDYDRQYYLYKLGYSYELTDKAGDALAAYRQAYELDKYSQIAYQVEERLFALRAKRPSVDLSFLYPYNPLEIQELPPPPSSQSTVADTTAQSPQTLMLAIDPLLPIKILAKPQSGIYLQSGRFSVEGNARRLCESIRAMPIPAVYFEETHQGKASWVVLAGPFDSTDQSARAREILSNGEINSFVVQF
jgi:tetratricopeptide (TPR) repeat protein